jgi:hypothetical protein
MKNWDAKFRATQDPLSGRITVSRIPAIEGSENDFTFDSIADLRAVLNQRYDPGAIESLISELAVSGSAEFGITKIEKMDPAQKAFAKGEQN